MNPPVEHNLSAALTSTAVQEVQDHLIAQLVEAAEPGSLPDERTLFERRGSALRELAASMPGLIGSPQIIAAFDAAIWYAKSTKAANTLKTYSGAWKRFVSWALDANAKPLPANDAVVAAYMAARASTGLSPKTVDVDRAAIDAAHRIAGFDPPGRGIISTSVAAGIARRAQHGSRQRRPLSILELKAMVEAVDAAGETNSALRNRCILLVGFASSRREDELVSLTRADVEFVVDPKTKILLGATLYISSSKTDQTGRGETVGLSMGTSPTSCPVLALQRWMAALDAERLRDPTLCAFDALFCYVDRYDHCRGQSLHPETIAAIVKEFGAAIGLDPKRLGGHALRAGFVTEASAAGIPPQEIARQTGHKSLSTLLRYNRPVDVIEKSPTKKLGL